MDPVVQNEDASTFTAQHARAVVNCIECTKPRVIYARHRLTDRQSTALTIYLSEVEYSCGSPLIPPNHPLEKVLFVRVPLTCADTVELAYYGTGFGAIDICCYCATGDCQLDADLKNTLTRSI